MSKSNNSLLALIAFRGREAELLLPPTRSLQRAKKSLADLPGGGGTPLAHGIEQAMLVADQGRRSGGIPLVVFLIGYILVHRGASRAEIVASMHNPVIADLMGLTIANLVWHMRLGLQVVIEDYVHTDHTKYLLLLLNTFFSVVMAVAGLYAILKMSIGL